MKRGWLKRSPKAVRRQSAKGEQYEEEFEAARVAVMARSKGFCEARRVALTFCRVFDDEAYQLIEEMAEGCRHRATHVHHRKYRSRGGTNGVDNLVAMDSDCHRWVHDHPISSNRIGLSLKAGQDEAL